MSPQDFLKIIEIHDFFEALVYINKFIKVVPRDKTTISLNSFYIFKDSILKYLYLYGHKDIDGCTINGYEQISDNSQKFILLSFCACGERYEFHCPIKRTNAWVFGQENFDNIYFKELEKKREDIDTIDWQFFGLCLDRIKPIKNKWNKLFENFDNFKETYSTLYPGYTFSKKTEFKHIKSDELVKVTRDGHTSNIGHGKDVIDHFANLDKFVTYRGFNKVGSLFERFDNLPSLDENGKIVEGYDIDRHFVPTLFKSKSEVDGEVRWNIVWMSIGGMVVNGIYGANSGDEAVTKAELLIRTL